MTWTRCCRRWPTRADARCWRSCGTIRRRRASWPTHSRSPGPGVSRHLRVLREAGLVDVRQEAQRRIYSLRPEALVEVDEWLEELPRALAQPARCPAHGDRTRKEGAEDEDHRHDAGARRHPWRGARRGCLRHRHRRPVGARARRRSGSRAGSPRCPATCAWAARSMPSSPAPGPARRGSRPATLRSICCSRRSRARTTSPSSRRGSSRRARGPGWWSRSAACRSARCTSTGPAGRSTSRTSAVRWRATAPPTRRLVGAGARPGLARSAGPSSRPEYRNAAVG